ncbi:MAG: ABC transporter ATP-binding protein [Ignavibacteriae bacterium]|nr:ABC transporter ATP-binding protein [Ignavibacteriota bacterium]
MAIIQTQNLNFGFIKNQLVVDDINLKIEEGNIYGFIGPNGAGKTTTIRLLLGLLKPNIGNIQLFGKSITTESLWIFQNIGAMIEMPSLYEHLTGFDNLQITTKIKNVSYKRINEVLEIVKLSNSSMKKVKEYSLGMKQRLGLALALLSEPKLLILDEPTNGLDPQGMIETRELLVKLNKEYGTTILISSHLLSEIEKIVTHLGIINKGRLIFQGTINELHNLPNENSLIQIETNDNERAFSLLNNDYKINYNNGKGIQIVFQSREQVSKICKALVYEGLDIYHFHVTTNNLEEIFLTITNN